MPARQSAYADPALAETYKFIPALVESWQEGVPEFRPRFAEWPAITEIVQEWGTKMMLGEVSIEEGVQDDRREDGSGPGRGWLLRRQEASGPVTGRCKLLPGDVLQATRPPSPRRGPLADRRPERRVHDVPRAPAHDRRLPWPGRRGAGRSWASPPGCTRSGKACTTST